MLAAATDKTLNYLIKLTNAAFFGGSFPAGWSDTPRVTTRDLCLALCYSIASNRQRVLQMVQLANRRKHSTGRLGGLACGSE
jgi:hypothetical protein